VELVDGGPRCGAHRLPRRRGGGWRRVRDAVLAASPVCVVCGAAAVEVDHVVPLAEGGDSHPGNLQPLCARCHAAKTAAEA